MKKNKEYIKKVLAFLLCFVMLSGVSPLNALAEIDFSHLNISLPSLRLPEFNFFGTKASADEDEPAYSGYCGLDEDEDGEPDYNVTWRYEDETKTLYIDGEGIMANYSPENPAPWNMLNLNCEIENIDFGHGWLEIGDYAFYDFTALTNLFILGNVMKLGRFAFGRSFNADNDGNFEYIP
ncbi:MAG: hypothetical protein IJM10_03545, partial [Clostridia bacterium]|nr:hypothetical protein [Clostridia bacterium]